MFVTLPLINPVLQSRNIKLKYFTIKCVEKKEKEINKTKPLCHFFVPHSYSRLFHDWRVVFFVRLRKEQLECEINEN